MVIYAVIVAEGAASTGVGVSLLGAPWAAAEPVAVVLSSAVVLLTAVITLFWWLHRVLNRLEGKVVQELDHNGGSSMKDMARDARDSARETAVAVSLLRQEVQDLRVDHLALKASLRSKRQS